MLIMKFPFLSNIFRRSSHSGVDFVVTTSGNTLYCVQVNQIAGRPHVATYLKHQLTGEKSTATTTVALEKIRKRLGSASFQFSTLLAPGEYQLLQVEAPNVPDEEIKSAVRWSIKDSLNFHVDDAALDVFTIPSGTAIGERKKSLYVVAASSVVIKKCTDLFQRAHMKLRVIDIPEMAQRNVAALYEQEGRALALLAFDDSGGLLTFTCNGELYLARRIEISIGQLQDANETLRQQYVDRLELEMQRSIDHFDRQFSHLGVNRLLVSAPQELGLVEQLGNYLGMPVQKLELSEVMDFSATPELVAEDAQVYAFHVIGAAMRQEEASS